jgi:hypothetical protein
MGTRFRVSGALLHLPMTPPIALSWIVLGVAAATSAGALERKAYKYVDEKGNVTYSQTPPANGKDASKIDISPANSSRLGPGWDRSFPGSRGWSTDAPRYEDAARERARKLEEARRQRMAELEAECNRARGTDCKNPDTLRYIESEKIPRRGR